MQPKHFLILRWLFALRTFPALSTLSALPALPAFIFQVPCYEAVFFCFGPAKSNSVGAKNPVDAIALFVKFPARLTDLE
jgi:hypothetical protein